jgi:hypothetical protein
MDASAEEKAKARRAIRLLYLLMALGILVPLVFVVVRHF